MMLIYYVENIKFFYSSLDLKLFIALKQTYRNTFGLLGDLTRFKNYITCMKDIMIGDHRIVIIFWNNFETWNNVGSINIHWNENKWQSQLI